MVQKTNASLEIAKKFKRKASGLLRISRMILFGSRARGDFHEESDFDIIVVSNDFEATPFYKRPVRLYGLWDEKYPLELICYTEKELRKKQENAYSTASEAARAGIAV